MSPVWYNRRDLEDTSYALNLSTSLNTVEERPLQLSGKVRPRPKIGNLLWTVSSCVRINVSLLFLGGLLLVLRI